MTPCSTLQVANPSTWTVLQPLSQSPDTYNEDNLTTTQGEDNEEQRQCNVHAEQGSCRLHFLIHSSICLGEKWRPNKKARVILLDPHKISYMV